MLIGIDVGTTAVKAALFDAGGQVLRRFGERYPTARPRPGHVEQDPAQWNALVQRALAVLGEGVDVVGIGLCSQVNTHVFTDDKGNAFFPPSHGRTRAAPKTRRHSTRGSPSMTRSAGGGHRCRSMPATCWPAWPMWRARRRRSGPARAT